MTELTYTLLGDGTSDKALMPIIDWTIRQHTPNLVIQSQWADFSYLNEPPPVSRLPGRIHKALQLFPCDWLIIHRDSERQSLSERYEEIMEAWREMEHQYGRQKAVGIVPVRMTEAWLLFDTAAIRLASGNPSGKQRLMPPALHRMEDVPDPKQTLHHLLREASGLSGRRLQKLNVARAVQLVANNIQDFTPLRQLSAYQAFDAAIQNAVQHL